jgi:putative NIF3 family GTP cyclohydrolase 1 type 2
VKLSILYKNIVRFGAKLDPRKNALIKAYEDTAILYGRPDTEVNNILVGIDIDSAEILLADKLRRTQELDLVVSHHPAGLALARFYEVMNLQVDILVKFGLPREVARQFIEVRKYEVERGIIARNNSRAVDTARLLDMPFMCAHTPADNHAADFIQKLMDRRKPGRVEDIIDILLELPEYQLAKKELSGPRIILGSPRRPAGKVYVDMTGGTEGSREVFGKLYKAGVRTLVCMHLSEGHFYKAKDNNLNAVIAGHISSDTLGLNLLLDKVEKEAGQELHCIGCSGFRRFRHT